MVYHKPPSPAEHLENGFQHLLYHNAHTPFRQDGSEAAYFGYPDPHGDVQKQDFSGYSSYLDAALVHGQYPELSHVNDIGLGIHYTHVAGPDGMLTTAYASPSDFQVSPKTRFPRLNREVSADSVKPLSTSVPESIVLTPKSSESDTGRRARNARAARSASPYVRPSESSESNRSAKAARPRKSKQAKNTVNAPKLDSPLSVLTKDMDTVPVRDMEAWVHRSVESRLREVEKKNGHVVRPMNSFMLYRAAYQDRTKAWCAQNNHQVVSAVSGESWPMEPKEVRDFYNELARIERENHAKAHPTYKFSPSKAGSKVKKKGGAVSGAWASDEEEDADGDLSGNDDPDWEWRPRSERRSTRLARRYQNRQLSSSSSPLTQHVDFSVDGAPLTSPTWGKGMLDQRPLPAPLDASYLYHTQQPPPYSPHVHTQAPMSTPVQQHAQPNFAVPSNFANTYSPDMFHPSSMSQHSVLSPSPSHNHHFQNMQSLHDPFTDAFYPDTPDMFDVQVDPTLLGFRAQALNSGGRQMMEHMGHEEEIFGGPFGEWMESRNGGGMHR